MKQAITLTAVILIATLFGVQFFGRDTMYLAAHGAISLMALLIAATFLWLWKERTTPLALGMSLSWAGSGLVMGWLWLMKLLGEPAWGQEALVLFMFLSLLVSGAVLHFAVIQASFGLRGLSFLWPVFGTIALSFGIALLV